MHYMMDWMTKKKMFLLGFLSLIGFTTLFSGEALFFICPTRESICINTVKYLILFFLLGVTLFTVSLVSFFVEEEIFVFWKKTLPFYLIVYGLTLLFVPWYLGDGFMHIQKDLTALFISVCYVLFSIILIATQYWRLRKRKKLPEASRQ